MPRPNITIEKPTYFCIAQQEVVEEEDHYLVRMKVSYDENAIISVDSEGEDWITVDLEFKISKQICREQGGNFPYLPFQLQRRSDFTRTWWQLSYTSNKKVEVLKPEMAVIRL